MTSDDKDSFVTDLLLSHSKPASIAIFFTYLGTWFDYIDLYPHGLTDHVILVKSETIKNTAASDKLLKSPLLTVWASAIIVFSIFRISARQLLSYRYADNRSHNDIFYILFNTFGLSFGMTSAYGLHSRAEMVIVLFVSLFSMLAGIRTLNRLKFQTGYQFVPRSPESQGSEVVQSTNTLV